ncbi:hypothetical protein EIP91_009157 [Steccherinum ochraceum]|uniref:Uncharacterized protein n=1 Tax=Steccherinum ochraceum TaxID=92696 RepID=A0A4R0RBS0_9APHY|nr:hypothetical protein EIP91_009157 [Steccherinum ochraceum]
MDVGPKRDSPEPANNTPLVHKWHARCKSLTVVDNTLTLLGFLSTAAFSTFRIWAIWGHALGPTVAVAVASAVVPAMNLYAFTQATFFAVADVEYTTRSAAVARDALVLVLTWIRTADVWRESRKINPLKITVTTLLLRDGTIYFGMLLIVNIVVFLLNALESPLRTPVRFTAVLYAIDANLLARFILDLRSVHESGSNAPQNVSSVVFAASLGGNMGAPLGIEDSTWVTGPADDVANEHGQQYEEAVVPFRAGLGLDPEEVPSVEAASTDRDVASNSASVGSSLDIEEVPRNGSTTADSV